MDASSHPLLCRLLLISLGLSVLAAIAAGADIYALVYKGCANQTLPPAGLRAVEELSTSLSTQSSSGFYKTTASISSSSSSLFGLFQCRGDLSPSDCSSCVARAVPMFSSLCPGAVAARVQLAGCLALYEISGFPQVSGTQLLFKNCGSGGGGGGFEVKRDTAFSQLEGGIGTGNTRFYATSYGSVYAMAQCEGELSVADCSECVSQAVQKSEVECGGAPSGQVYLDKCYISYSYYKDGSPHDSGGGGGYSIGGGSGGGGQQTEKTVAIILGGAAGLGFVVIFLLFVRSLLKRKDW